jgi:hypothetical protein
VQDACVTPTATAMAILLSTAFEIFIVNVFILVIKLPQRRLDVVKRLADTAGSGLSMKGNGHN